MLIPIRGQQLNKTDRFVRHLISAWIFTENTGVIVNDICGRFTMTGYDSFGWSAGKFKTNGNFIESGGNYTYLKTNRNIGGTELSPDYITVVAFIKPAHTNDCDIVAAWRSGDSTAQSYMLWGDSPIWEFIVKSTAGANAAANGNNIVANTYIHLAGTYDGQYARLYENGVQTGVDSMTPNPLRDAGNYPLYIATKDLLEGTDIDHFYGDISYILIFNVALLASEIKFLYENHLSFLDIGKTPFDVVAAPPTVTPVKKPNTRLNIIAA